MAAPKPVILCILDGWGVSATETGNAPGLANTPVMDELMRTCPQAQLTTHGPDVGLPVGQMGNSEVGHMNIGAGRIVRMELGRIDNAIETGEFAKNTALQSFVQNLQSTGGAAHLLGLISDGGVHGQLSHMIETAHILVKAGIPVWIHGLTDGRDVAPRSAYNYLNTLTEALPEGARIATLTGRYFALDRDHRWPRVQEATEAILHANGLQAPDVHAAVTKAYARSESDEFISATVLNGYHGTADGDGLFCLNFRADRARQIMSALADPGFDAYDVGSRPKWAALLGMVPYSAHHSRFLDTAFPRHEIVNTLGAWVAAHGLRQFRLAETEKYPHVTFFLNGGKETQEPGEDRFMPASPKVATYDLQPEMSAQEVSERLLAAINDAYDLIVVNFANPDMVGHTGDLQAAVKACEAVDKGLAAPIAAVRAMGGAMIVTADHGNCEVMIDPETGAPHTAHTLNPVPVLLLGGPEGAKLRPGRLADLAPTVLELMGLDKPAEMTGQSLLI